MASEPWAFSSIRDTPGPNDLCRSQRTPQDLRGYVPTPQLPSSLPAGSPCIGRGPFQVLFTRILPTGPSASQGLGLPSALFTAEGPGSLEGLSKHLLGGSE